MHTSASNYAIIGQSSVWYLKKKTKLDDRLVAVAERIRANVHVDVGSDHGKLLLWLLKHQQINRGIAIENNQRPFQNSTEALRVFFPPRPADGTAPGIAEVRFGDGLAALQPHEADSLSICGLGGRAVVRILSKYPIRVPKQLVVQPNNRPEDVRRWALASGFRLLDEVIVGDERNFIVLTFQRHRENDGDQERDSKTYQDPAYEAVDFDAAILFGPLIIKRNEPALMKQLNEELAYWAQFSELATPAIKRLKIVESLANSIVGQTLLGSDESRDLNKA